MLHGKQIKNTSISSGKIDLTGTFDFTSGAVSVANPSSAAHAASKSYVDSAVTGGQAGLDFKDSAVVATTANLSATLSANVLTASANGTLSIDGVAPSVNDRVLVKDQTSGLQNGVYTVTTTGSASAAFSLTRASDADSSSEMSTGAFIFIERGTLNKNKSFVLQAKANGDSPALNTDDLSFIQFSGAGQITAGDGLSKVGDTLKLDIYGLSELESVAQTDEIAIYDSSAGTCKSIALLDAIEDLFSGNGFAKSNGLITQEIRSQFGLGVTSTGLGLSYTNMSNLASGSITNTQAFVMADTGAARRVSFHEMLTQLAGGGLTADTTNHQLDAATPQLDAGQSASVNSDNVTTGITISSTPVDGSSVQIFVNGVGAHLAGSTGGGDCFFSDGSGGARALNAITANDALFWNGSSSYSLDSGDRIEIRYNA